MQIKSTMRYHFIPVTMSIIKKARCEKYWQGCGKNGTFVYCCGNVNFRSNYGKQYGVSSENHK